MSVTFRIYLIPTFKIYISRKRYIIFHRKISYNSIFHWQAYVSECSSWFRVCMACLFSPKTYTDIPSPSSCHKPTQQPFGGSISRESLAQSCESKRQSGRGNVLVMPWISQQRLSGCKQVWLYSHTPHCWTPKGTPRKANAVVPISQELRTRHKLRWRDINILYGIKCRMSDV